MPLDPTLKADLDRLVNKNPVVLFMKGTRQGPQCGFSARVVETLDVLLDSYETVNVLEDEGIRDGIKLYSDWPTIPQLYINGEFVGGCDIVQEMADSGQLAEALGCELPETEHPKITVTEAAAEHLLKAVHAAQGSSIRVLVTKDGRCSMALGSKRPDDVEIISGAVSVILDPFSSSRADGLVIDHVRQGFGSGFVMEIR